MVLFSDKLCFDKFNDFQNKFKQPDVKITKFRNLVFAF